MGAKVAVNYVAVDPQNEIDAREVVDRLGEMHVDALAVEANVRDGESVKRMIDAVVAKWERLDILINNAGITRDTLLLRMSEQSWDDVIDINLRGTFLCSKHALKPMMRGGWGALSVSRPSPESLGIRDRRITQPQRAESSHSARASREKSALVVSR